MVQSDHEVPDSGLPEDADNNVVPFARKERTEEDDRELKASMARHPASHPLPGITVEPLRDRDQSDKIDDDDNK